MGELAGKVLEAKAVLWAIKVYNILLDFIVGFLFSAFMLQVVGLSLLWAVVPAFAFALFRLLQEYLDRNFIMRLKGKYDRLDERLKTALEHQGARNVIVEDLMADVTKRMDDVETSTFMDSSDVSKRVYAIVALSFLLLTVTVLDLRSVLYGSVDYLLDTVGLKDQVANLAGKTGTGFEAEAGNKWENSSYADDNREKLGAQPGGERPGASQGPIPGKGSGTGADTAKDIYGKASSANIAGKDVDFRLHPEYGGDIEIRETGGLARDNEFRLDSVESVEECAECVVGPEHEELVRKYFEKILPDA